MQSQLFNEFIQAIPLLTNQQRNILDESLSEQDNSASLEQVIETRFLAHPECPNCHSKSIKKWGIRCNRQRYKCKTCDKTFNAFSKTPLARLRHPEKWQKYLNGMTNSQTLRPAAKACGITLRTSFRWRHRFLSVVEDDQAEELGDIVELDETFLRESFKGQRKKLPRPARKRGSDDKSECRKVPVMVARDRQKHTVDGVMENETADELCRHLNGHISMEAIVCADASKAHEKLARKLGFPFKKLTTSAGEKVIDGIFHLQHVNSYHGHLKLWITGVFHGVATKYLKHYLGWRRKLTERIPLTVDRWVEKIASHWCSQPLKAT